MSSADVPDVDTIEEALEEGIRRGHLERVPGSPDDDPRYRITAAGRAWVEARLAESS